MDKNTVDLHEIKEALKKHEKLIDCWNNQYSPKQPCITDDDYCEGTLRVRNDLTSYTFPEDCVVDHSAAILYAKEAIKARDLKRTLRNEEVNPYFVKDGQSSRITSSSIYLAYIEYRRSLDALLIHDQFIHSQPDQLRE